MIKLMQLATNVIHKENEECDRRLASISENMHDIQLYLDVNKDALPAGSEVDIVELFHLLKISLGDLARVQESIAVNDKWLSAMRQGGE